MEKTKKIFETPNSSRIEKIIFLPVSRSIRIVFKGGKVYIYKSVSEFDYRMFLSDIEDGMSPGKSFEKWIRNKYAGKKL